MTVNKAMLLGNLGQDPELRHTAGGTAVTTLRLATTHRMKDRNGTWADQTEWHSVVVWGKRAETVAQFCRKGKQLYIEGRIQTRKWQDRDGKDRFSTEIVADDVRFVGGREPASPGYDAGGGYGGGDRSVANPIESRPGDEHFPEDSIPF